MEEDFSYFADDDERVVDETTMALSLLSVPPDLAPELSQFARTLCYTGILCSAILIIATFLSLWHWLDWSNFLLLAFQVMLVVGVWFILLLYCSVKLLSDNQVRLVNEDLLEEHQRVKGRWFEELHASKRDARLRKNRALVTELRIRETHLSANAEGNRDVIWIPETGQMIIPPAGQFIQPVPNSYHYHNQMLPGPVKVTEDTPKGLPAPEFPAPIKFEDILRDGFTPTSQNIYLFTTVNGSINEAMSEVCHVGLAARTGGGKTNTTRLLTAQFEYAKGRVYLASPNFAQLKLNKNHLEDWRPIVQHLAAPPAQSNTEIRTLLLQFRQLFEHRKSVEQRTARRGPDVYLILGEWPGIVKRVKEAPEILELLLRESRQYGIHIVTEFQDALVKTLGLDSGVRENLLHCYYFGGDPITAKIVLDLAKGVSLNETGLGKYGAAYMRANEKSIVAGRVPHFTNRALYMLLGTPPDPVTDDEIFDESQVPETYYHVDENGQYVDGGAFVDLEEQDGPPSPSRQSFFMPETPRVVDAQSRPFTPQERVVRPDGKQEQDTFSPRTGTRQDEQDSAYWREDEQFESAQQNGVRRPPDRAHTTQNTRTEERTTDYPLLSDLQIELFTTAYQITGNIDRSLEHASANTRYREHAREIIRERNLKKREA